MLDFENEANPYDERRRIITAWSANATVDVTASEVIIRQAKEFARFGIPAKDALHLACAVSGECSHFVTTDDLILHRAGKVDEIVIVDPPSLVREMDV
jgi:predicted nucleic acid-binding protein